MQLDDRLLDGVTSGVNMSSFGSPLQLGSALELWLRLRASAVPCCRQLRLGAYREDRSTDAISTRRVEAPDGWLKQACGQLFAIRRSSRVIGAHQFENVNEPLTGFIIDFDLVE